MRIVFMGTPDFAVAALNSLVEAGHDVAAVVTQPDKPKGRGKAVSMTPVKEKALACGIPVYQPARVREEAFIQVLREIAPEVIVVAAFGQILSKAVLDLPKYGCVNIHASLLPKYRGSAPIQYAVINGEKESGITTMQMADGIDTGDILEQEAVALDAKETGGSLHDKLMEIGGRLILSTLKKIEDGTAVATPQPEEGACYVKPIPKSMGDIDWSADALSIERLIRGLNPWPSAYTHMDGKTMKIWEAEAADEEFEGVCGQIVATGREDFTVKAGKGCLKIRSIQPEGKKRMDTGAFLRGYKIEEGTVLERSV